MTSKTSTEDAGETGVVAAVMVVASVIQRIYKKNDKKINKEMFFQLMFYFWTTVEAASPSQSNPICTSGTNKYCLSVFEILI